MIRTSRLPNSGFFVALSAIVFMGTAAGDVLIPGTNGAPDIFSFTCPGVSCPTLLASTTTPWVNTTSTMSGTMVSEVFSDPTNTFGAGDLDFVYQVSNDGGSTDSIGRVTGITFTGFLTDVGYASDGSELGLVDGTVAPQLVDRASAATIGFTFDAPILTLVGPGETSTVLVIETNATTYTGGSVNVIDGGVTTVAAYEPAGAPPTTPEPASMLMIGSGLILLLTSRKLIHKRPQFGNPV